MAQENKRNDSPESAPSDEATQLKKRARRRLIGAMALALLAAVTLPMVMDHKPAPPLKDIQVRIPSPDEGVTQRVAPQAVKPVEKSETKPIAKIEPKPEVKAEVKPEAKPEVKPETKPETKREARQEAEVTGESWEVQLGAYQEPGRVKLLVGKLKELGIPTYTEKVETPGGVRTRVRAGPFPTQEAAESARVRVKIVGVDGPVARKP